MRGGLLCQAGRSNDLHKASGLENLFKPNAMKLASMAEVQPSLCNYPNPRPHEVSDLCALGLPQVKAAGLVQASWPAKLSPDNNN